MNSTDQNFMLTDGAVVPKRHRSYEIYQAKLAYLFMVNSPTGYYCAPHSWPVRLIQPHYSKEKMLWVTEWKYGFKYKTLEASIYFVLLSKWILYIYSFVSAYGLGPVNNHTIFSYEWRETVLVRSSGGTEIVGDVLWSLLCYICFTTARAWFSYWGSSLTPGKKPGCRFGINPMTAKATQYRTFIVTSRYYHWDESFVPGVFLLIWPS